MKIASTMAVMDSTHTYRQDFRSKESLTIWSGEREKPGRQTPTIQASPPQISDAGMRMASSEAEAIRDGVDAIENDPILQILRSIVALLTGEEVKVFDASELAGDSSTAPSTPPPDADSQSSTPSSPQAGFGVEYVKTESFTEVERTSFQASGVVKTVDGQEIQFAVSLEMARIYREESSTSILLGDARRKQDPLIVNFGGTAAQLTNQRFQFDLDVDGKDDNINFATGGSGFLVFDRNGDGKINNGSELFGTRSGNGFADLNQLDDDHNGWIDENDAAYAKLEVWSKDASGQDHMQTLQEAGIGALGLANVETPFDIKNGNNELLAQIRTSGVFLMEKGGTGTLQQVDLTV